MSRGPYTCCLCGSEEFGYGHNPAPLAGDHNRACDSCNATKVIPARLAMMFPSDREFASEDSHELATAAIVGGIFTVSMGALLEHLGTALNKKDAAAATFFKDCIDYMGMSMVSSYEENTKDFPKEVKYAIDMTLGMTAKQLGEWEADPEFEELTNLGSSEDPDVDTMSEVVLDDAQEFEDDFGVMYSAEEEYPCEICGDLLVRWMPHDGRKLCRECYNVAVMDYEPGESEYDIKKKEGYFEQYEGPNTCGVCGKKMETFIKGIGPYRGYFGRVYCGDHYMEINWYDPDIRTKFEESPCEHDSVICVECDAEVSLSDLCAEIKNTEDEPEVFKCSCGGNLLIEEVLFVECDQCGATDYQAESYADFFTQMEELLESTTIAGGWTLDATTDQEDPDAVTMVVKFKPADPSTFFDIIE